MSLGFNDRLSIVEKELEWTRTRLREEEKWRNVLEGFLKDNFAFDVRARMIASDDQENSFMTPEVKIEIDDEVVEILPPPSVPTNDCESQDEWTRAAESESDLPKVVNVFGRNNTLTMVHSADPSTVSSSARRLSNSAERKVKVGANSNHASRANGSPRQPFRTESVTGPSSSFTSSAQSNIQLNRPGNIGRKVGQGQGEGRRPSWIVVRKCKTFKEAQQYMKQKHFSVQSSVKTPEGRKRRYKCKEPNCEALMTAANENNLVVLRRASNRTHNHPQIKATKPKQGTSPAGAPIVPGNKTPGSVTARILATATATRGISQELKDYIKVHCGVQMKPRDILEMVTTHQIHGYQTVTAQQISSFLQRERKETSSASMGNTFFPYDLLGGGGF